MKDVLEQPGERTYSPRDFPAYEVQRQAITGEGRRPHYGGNGQGSQSERDWSYALRALERGDSPAVIEAKIEQSRQDKPNPHYYAQRTVSRAVAHASSNSTTRSAGSTEQEPSSFER